MMALLSPRVWLAIACAMFFAGCNFASYRAGKANVRADWNVEKLATAAAVLTATDAARTREQALQATVTKAQNDAKTRETKLVADAATASRANVSLRDDLAAIRASLPGLARDAINRYADTASNVFAECSQRYSDLARQTDAIASDRQTLIEAWPK
jgi:hypothetical protein